MVTKNYLAAKYIATLANNLENSMKEDQREKLDEELVDRAMINLNNHSDSPIQREIKVLTILTLTQIWEYGPQFEDIITKKDPLHKSEKLSSGFDFGFVGSLNRYLSALEQKKID